MEQNLVLSPMRKIFTLWFSWIILAGYGQTQVSGRVIDENGNPLPYVSIIFTGTTQGTISDENGKFFLASDKKQSSITLAYLGYKTRTVPLKSRNNTVTVRMEPEAETLETVTIAAGKPKNKNNPAIDILKNIWKHKHRSGLNLYDYYEYDKYEKIEFDIYNVDSTLLGSPLLKGFEFIWNYVDTSRITGKAFLPVFLNEAFYKVYGKNIPPAAKREDLTAHRASGVKNNEFVNLYLKDIYLTHNVYANFITVFGKEFISPLSKLGPTTYYYVLADTAQLNGKTAYNIIFYPRRKGDLAFKGDLWVADSSFAVLNISMYISRTANINWIKEFYLEQSFDIINDSTTLMTKDFVMTEFGWEKAENTPDLLIKKTTYYFNHRFNHPHPDKFYRKAKSIYDADIYEKTWDFWNQNRPEKLNFQEKGIYQMLDSLQNTPKFRRMQDIASIIGSGYAYVKYFDYGPVFSTFGYNDVEGFRVRVGGRTYFDTNDPWRLEGYVAYGFKDRRMKYGISGKALLHIPTRLMINAGYRQDIEQTGVSLMIPNDDVLSRSFASSSLFATGDRNKLTLVEIFQSHISWQPVKNWEISAGWSYQILQPAHAGFTFDYVGDDGHIYRKVEQPEIFTQLQITPGRKWAGYGVKTYPVNTFYPVLSLRYTRGYKTSSPRSFDYHKIQLLIDKPFRIGAFGKLDVRLESGKTAGSVPLVLLNVIPGNQSYFYVNDAFQLLDYYEFVTDTYAAVRMKHNFGGRIFSKLPLLNRTKWRELIFFNAVSGRISPENIQRNASGLTYQAPDPFYFEYGVGITNIFKVLEFDMFWRGNYRKADVQNFFIKTNFTLDF